MPLTWSRLRSVLVSAPELAVNAAQVATAMIGATTVLTIGQDWAFVAASLLLFFVTSTLICIILIVRRRAYRKSVLATHWIGHSLLLSLVLSVLLGMLITGVRYAIAPDGFGTVAYGALFVHAGLALLMVFGPILAGYAAGPGAAGVIAEIRRYRRGRPFAPLSPLSDRLDAANERQSAHMLHVESWRERKTLWRWIGLAAVAVTGFFAVQVMRHAGVVTQRGLNQALLAAAYQGDADRVRKLIADGADPSFQQGESLYQASRKGDLETIRTLFNHGLPTDCAYAPEALQRVILNGKSAALELMLSRGVPPDWWLYEGQTPLLLAVEWNRPICVRHLLKYGADPTLKDRRGRSAFDAARAHGNRVLLEILNNPPGRVRPKRRTTNAP